MTPPVLTVADLMERSLRTCDTFPLVNSSSIQTYARFELLGDLTLKHATDPAEYVSTTNVPRDMMTITQAQASILGIRIRHCAWRYVSSPLFEYITFT